MQWLLLCNNPPGCVWCWCSYEPTWALSWVSKVSPYVAGGYFGQYKMMQKSWKMTETLANGYSSEITQQDLSNEYQHDRV